MLNSALGASARLSRQAYVNGVECGGLLLAASRPSSSGFRSREDRRRYHRGTHDEEQSGQSSRSRWFRYSTSAGAPLLGLSWMVTLKDFFGIEQAVELDKDPLKDKLKQSWLHRKYGQFNDAVQILEIALEEAVDRKEEMPITRVYDELANTYHQKGDLDKAEEFFRIVLGRLMHLHKKRDEDPEFIGVSLKLADIFAQKGDLDAAEAGFKHCVRKQMRVMEEHQKKFLIKLGAWAEEKNLVDTLGPAYTDPICLFGVALEQYAHFLVKHRDETRLKEAEEYMDEVLKVYGTTGSAHIIRVLNNFGAALILKHRFESAAKYLKIGIDRILYVNDCASLLPGYYCNYAEALFHTGHSDEALEYAKKAVTLSRSEDPKVHKYCEQFLRDLERDANKGKRKTWWLF